SGFWLTACGVSDVDVVPSVDDDWFGAASCGPFLFPLFVCGLQQSAEAPFDGVDGDPPCPYGPQHPVDVGVSQGGGDLCCGGGGFPPAGGLYDGEFVECFAAFFDVAGVVCCF